jgi:hypothetical protein
MFEPGGSILPVSGTPWELVFVGHFVDRAPDLTILGGKSQRL